MSIRIDIRELPTRLDEALTHVASGDEVILTDGTTPRARLVACEQPTERVPGLHPGAFEVAADFDTPLPDEFWTGQQ